LFSLFDRGAHADLHPFPTRRSSDLRAPSTIWTTLRPASSRPMPRGAFSISTPRSPAGSGMTLPAGERGMRLSDLVRGDGAALIRSEEHTSELQSRENLVCRLLLEKK